MAISGGDMFAYRQFLVPPCQDSGPRVLSHASKPPSQQTGVLSGMAMVVVLPKVINVLHLLHLARLNLNPSLGPSSGTPHPLWTVSTRCPEPASSGRPRVPSRLPPRHATAPGDLRICASPRVPELKNSHAVIIIQSHYLIVTSTRQTPTQARPGERWGRGRRRSPWWCRSRASPRRCR